MIDTDKLFTRVSSTQIDLSDEIRYFADTADATLIIKEHRDGTRERGLYVASEFVALSDEQIRALTALDAQAEQFVDRNTHPDFDAKKWVRGWIRTPQPALGGQRPIDYMSTEDGRQLVSDMFERMSAGVYS